MTDVIAKGVHSPGLLARLQAAEGEQERLRAVVKVIDVKAVMAVIPAAVVRYRELVANLGSKTPIDVEQAREGDPQHHSWFAPARTACRSRSSR